MATAAQVKTLVAPLLAKRPDLVFSRRMIFQKPLHHVVSAVILDRASQIERVAVHTIIMPSYHPRFMHASWGWGISRPDGLGTYSFAQPDAGEFLCRELEEKVLPQLAAINDIPSFVAHATSNSLRKHRFDDGGYNFTTAAGLGELDQARLIGDQLKAIGGLELPGYDDEITIWINNKRHLYDLVCAGDRAGIIALLHRWEAETIADWGLAKYWEPSPFPIEQM